MAIPWKRVLMEGLIAGGIGFAVSAAFFAVLNVTTGQSFFQTPAVIGSVLFYGARDAGSITVSAGPVIACNGVYLAGYVVLGTLLALLTARADQGPQHLYIAAFVLIVAVLTLTGFGVALTSLMPNVLDWWSVLSAGVLAIIGMVLFLYRSHPALRTELGAELEN